MKEAYSILLVDDNPSDVLLTREALSDAVDAFMLAVVVRAFGLQASGYLTKPPSADGLRGWLDR